METPRDTINTDTAKPTETNAGSEGRAGRDDKGRFGKGNRGGPGNPFARQTARLRQAMLDAVTEDDIRAAIDALKEKAKQGDVAAIKLLLSYTVGKPAAAPDPDTLDQHEFATIQNNHAASVQSVINIVEGMPVEALLLILRAMLPALLDSKLKTAAEVLSPSAIDEEEEDDEDETPDAEAASLAQENIPDWMREIVNKEEAGRGNREAASRSENRATNPDGELPKSKYTPKGAKPANEEALNQGDPAAGSGERLNQGPGVDAELLRILIGRLGGMLDAHSGPIGNGSNGKNEANAGKAR